MFAMNPKMAPSAPHIQTKGHDNDSRPFSQSTTLPSPTEPMLVASPSCSSPNKRPKLSLQTASVPLAVGKSSTALSVTMSALGTSSPTVRNTFNNAYEIPHRPSPIGGSPNTAKWPKPVTSSISRREEPPYEMSAGTRGILRNAPYISSLRKSALSATNSASPRHGRRVFFPVRKQVAFKTTIEEEIKTVQYTARHSDLSSEEESEETLDERARKPMLLSPTRSGKHGRTLEDDEEGSEPRVPKVPKRKRKMRQWRWTLGSDEQEEEDSDITPTSEQSARPRLSISTSVPLEHSDGEDEQVRKTPFPFSPDEGNKADATSCTVNTEPEKTTT